MLSDMKAVKEGIYELTKDSIAQKNPNLVQQIEMTQPDADTFGLGDTLQLEIAVHPTSAAGSVHWNSSDDAVASVDENGLVTMKKEGKATITVCSADNANIAQSIEITVVVPEEKKALLQEWEKASELKKEHYTTASWAVLERIIEEADAILMKSDAGTQEIENVLKKLKEAIGNLKKAETTPPGNPGQDQKEPLEKGKVYRVGTENYVVLSTAPAKAALAGSTNRSMKQLSVPAEIVINDVTCKVTQINAKAFKNYKNLKRVTIGANVASIGNQAFSGCTKLNKLIFQGNKAPKIGKKAWKGAGKKIKVTAAKMKKKQKKELMKRLKKAGKTTKWK